MNKTIRYAVLGACALAASTGAAFAGSELTPGISTGIALGAPLPQGLYDVTIGTYQNRNLGGGASMEVGATAPAWLIWSTPWTVAGGRVMLDTVTPLVDANVTGAGPYDAHISGAGNTLLDAQLKWNLGGGLNAGVQAGVYLPSSSSVGEDLTSFQGLAAVSYLANGWNLTATFIYGTGGTASNGVWYADWFNYDLTATKKFGKWELGAVAFGSTDLNGVAKQSQFAVGPLVGYNFGPAEVQLKLTRDLQESNYGGLATAGWVNVIIPLWNPESESLK